MTIDHEAQMAHEVLSKKDYWEYISRRRDLASRRIPREQLRTYCEAHECQFQEFLRICQKPFGNKTVLDRERMQQWLLGRYQGTTYVSPADQAQMYDDARYGA